MSSLFSWHLAQYLTHKICSVNAGWLMDKLCLWLSLNQSVGLQSLRMQLSLPSGQIFTIPYPVASTALQSGTLCSYIVVLWLCYSVPTVLNDSDLKLSVIGATAWQMGTLRHNSHPSSLWQSCTAKPSRGLTALQGPRTILPMLSLTSPCQNLP